MQRLCIEVKWSKDESPGSSGARSRPIDDNDDDRSRLERGWITFDDWENRKWGTNAHSACCA